MKIFITGGNGSLGTELLGQIFCNETGTTESIDVIALAKDEADTCNLKKFPKAQIIIGDISGPVGEGLKKNLADADIFIHLAALVHNGRATPEDYMKVNFKATERLAEAFALYSMSDVKQFIFISTVSVYGNYKDEKYSEEDKCIPDTPYGESKLLAENILSEIALKKKLKVTILRPSTIYGGHDRGNIGKMIGFIRKYRFFPAFGGGNNLKSFLYVGDAAKAIIKCFNNPEAFNQIFNISSPALSIREIVRILSVRHKTRVLLLNIPLPFIKWSVSISKIARNNVYSYDKIRRSLGLIPIEFREGVLKIKSG